MISDLKDAVHDVVFNSGVPAKQLADKTGKSYSYIANAGNPNLEEFHLQARDIIPLTIGSGNPAIVKYICHAIGGAFISIPSASSADLTLNENILETIEHLSDLRKKYKEAVKDGELSRSERRELEALKFEIVTHVMSLLENITKGGT